MPPQLNQMLARPFRPHTNRASLLSLAALPGAVAAGAILIDVRPQFQRTTDGALPGALALAGDEALSRLVPQSPTRLRLATTHTAHWILISSTGTAGATLAGALRLRGVPKAIALVGGYRILKTTNQLNVAIHTPHFEQSVSCAVRLSS